jgi:Na+/proline symporter
VLRGALPRMNDRQFLWLTRAVVLLFGVLVTLYSLESNESIHAMVEHAYKVTLVAAFVPLVAGIYWKRATTQGAAAAIVLGLATWIGLEVLHPEGLWPPQLAGLAASATGMLCGSLLPQWYRGANPATAAV